MNFNFNDIKPEDYNKETFGRCIRKRREELGRSVRDVAKSIEMSPVYLSDIERSNRSAPTGANNKIDYLDRLVNQLQIQPDEVHAFYAMAEATSGRFADVNSYLSKKPIARMALRIADELNVPDDEWLDFIEKIRGKYETA